MSDIALRTVGLGKMYLIGSERVMYRTLRDTLVQAAKRPIERLRHPGAATHTSEELWALRDIDLEVKHGEALGIIGRNGSGKSTLLKVLSHITEPTEGRVEIRGRVASLLEVGTGFHGELTGRENIQLNGAILGMTRAEIKSKFDDIVEFSEISHFLDTPVKRYSSGMYVRLAFAVAAHLEPEILIIDEVLAVGDASFQKKCLGKMGDIAGEGKTVLFVSHNMPAVTRLCTRALLLDCGAAVEDGPVAEVTSRYLHSNLGMSAERRWVDVDNAPQSSAVRLVSVRIRDRDGRTVNSVDIREEVGVEIEYDVKEVMVLTPNIHVFDSKDAYVFVANDSFYPEWGNAARSVGRWKSTCWIPGNLLAEGVYVVGAAVSTMERVIVHFYEQAAVSFQVVEGPGGPTARGTFAGGIPGAVRPLLEWTSEYES
jgi:lipopolysaccharide transport system ATP-binding protein